MNTILFDLDGTLLPMEQKTFIENYFKRLVKRLAPFGYDKDALVKAVWAGTGAMVENDGKIPNSEAFWSCFEKILGEGARKTEPEFDDFYQNEFDLVKEVIGDYSGRYELIKLLKDRGYRIVLATNPLFPLVAVRTRLSWLGLSEEDFELITTYENCTSSKPNTAYYEDIYGKSRKS